MAVAVDLGWPSLPIKEEALGGLPVLGETSGRIAGALNYLALVRARRRVCHCEEHFQQPGAIPQPAEQTLLAFTPRPEARHLILAIEYAAIGDQKGSGGVGNWASIEASVRLLDGTVIDVGCRWAEDEGTLPVGRQVIGDTRTIDTGDIPNDVEAVGALAGQPRALSIDGVGGETIEVVVDAEWCAVTTVSAWEMPIGVVE